MFSFNTYIKFYLTPTNYGLLKLINKKNFLQFLFHFPSILTSPSKYSDTSLFFRSQYFSINFV